MGTTCCGEGKRPEEGDFEVDPNNKD